MIGRRSRCRRCWFASGDKTGSDFPGRWRTVRPGLVGCSERDLWRQKRFTLVLAIVNGGHDVHPALRFSRAQWTPHADHGSACVERAVGLDPEAFRGDCGCGNGGYRILAGVSLCRLSGGARDGGMIVRSLSQLCWCRIARGVGDEGESPVDVRRRRMVSGARGGGGQPHHSGVYGAPGAPRGMILRPGTEVCPLPGLSEEVIWRA